MKGFSLSHARHLTTIDLLSKMATLLQSVPTQAIKGAVLYNCYFLFTKTFDMFKWVLPSHMRKIIHLTQSDKSQIEVVTGLGKSQLPPELGGTGPKEENEGFDGGRVEKELFSDPNMIPTIKYMQNEVLIFTGYKQRWDSNL